MSRAPPAPRELRARRQPRAEGVRAAVRRLPADVLATHRGLRPRRARGRARASAPARRHAVHGDDDAARRRPESLAGQPQRVLGVHAVAVGGAARCGARGALLAVSQRRRGRRCAARSLPARRCCTSRRTASRRCCAARSAIATSAFSTIPARRGEVRFIEAWYAALARRRAGARRCGATIRIAASRTRS